MKKKLHTRVVLSFAISFFMCITLIGQQVEGLEGLIIEKYYVANANDAANTEGGNLANNSVTYRVFADMAPNFKFLAVYGTTGAHTLKLSTSTSFFNNSDRGKEMGDKISSSKVGNNTTAIDSWISVGGSSSGHIAVLKEDDTDGSIIGLNGLLTNNDTYAGIPLTSADGFIAGTPQQTTWLASGIQIIDVFGETAGNYGPGIEITDGSWSSLGGSVGATDDNYVLIGQFTTDGIFSFELNILLKDANNIAYRYVARDPNEGLGEVLFPALINTIGKDIKAPEVSIVDPIGGAIFPKDYSMPISVNVSDLDGTVDSVEYIINGKKIGSSNHAPQYSITWEAISGEQKITAVATDNDGARTVSSPVHINIVENTNVLPAVSLTSPLEGSYFVPDVSVSFKANANDFDGEITMVEFYLNDVFVGADNEGTETEYQYDWISVTGEYTLTAKAIDNYNGFKISEPVSIFVTSNDPPQISITSPAEETIVDVGEVITISTEVSDAEGPVTQVEFFVNGESHFIDNGSPFEYTWTTVAGEAKIIAIAQDADGANSSDTVNIMVNIPPGIVIVTPQVSEMINAGNIVNITVDERDDDGKVSSVVFYIDDQEVMNDTQSPFEYSWTSIQGIHEIKVKAIDNRNSSDLDSISVNVMGPDGIDISHSKVQLNIYPNPANESLMIQMSGINLPRSAKIEVISISGMIILNNSLQHYTDNNPVSLDISRLNKGFYFIRITAGERILYREFIKE
ncbi:MAG: T9SS type A sorting domain-containing protein [Bacteroidales bacterium]|nr:T9SS type A sorting domain-containing protein [Bacteroidales bacterium]MCF8391757.1 T9SS type A sorting domain-containing protein [Bacteroidales bacterium]